MEWNSTHKEEPTVNGCVASDKSRVDIAVQRAQNRVTVVDKYVVSKFYIDTHRGKLQKEIHERQISGGLPLSAG